MRSLEEQLAALGRHLEAEAPAITTAEIYSRFDTTSRRGNTMTLTVVEPDAPEQRDKNPKRPLLLVAAAVAALALVAGLIIVGGSDEEDPVPADQPEPTVPPVEPEPAAEAQALPVPGSDLEPGRYETELLGIPVSFTVPETTNMWAATANRVMMINTTSMDYPVTSRTLSLNRISGWNNREEADDGSYLGDGSIDPYDVEGWIAVNDVIAGEPTTMMVAGRQATVVDVQLEPGAGSERLECVDDQTCVWAASISEKTTGGRGPGEPRLSTGQISRFWVISIEGADPLLVHAAASVDDEAWLRTVAETTIGTLELGPDAPPAGAD